MRRPATARKGGGRSLYRWPDGREGQMTNEMRGQVMHRHARWLALAVLLVLGACGPGQEAADPTGPTPPASEPSPTTTIQDIMELEDFAPLEPGTYFIDPDSDPSTPLRVEYEVPVEGWSQWIGAVKGTEDGHVMREHHHRGEPVRRKDAATIRRPIPGRTERRRPRCRAGGPGPVPGDVAPEGRDHVRLPREVPGTHRARPAGRGQGTTASPDASTATSRAGSRPVDVAGARGRVLRLHGPWLQRGVLDPRRRRDPPGDRWPDWSPGSPPEDLAEHARHPRLDPDRAMRLLKTSAPDGGRRLARATTGAGEVEAMRRRFTNASAIGEGATGRRPAVGAATISVLAALMVWVALPASAQPFSPWAPAQKVDDIGGNSSELNTTFLDGCPIQSPDGTSLYMASTDQAGSAASHLGCPPAQHKRPVGGAREPGGARELRGRRLLPYPGTGGWTVLREQGGAAGSCGMADVYFTRRSPVHGWSEPVNLGCGANGGPNSALDEMGRSYVEVGDTALALLLERPRHLPQRASDGRHLRAGGARSGAEQRRQRHLAERSKDGLEVVFASKRRAGATRRSSGRPGQRGRSVLRPGGPGGGREHDDAARPAPPCPGMGPRCCSAGPRVPRARPICTSPNREKAAGDNEGHLRRGVEDMTSDHPADVEKARKKGLSGASGFETGRPRGG